MILTAMLAVVLLLVGSPMLEVKGDDPDKKGYPVPPGWELGLGLTTTPRKT